MLPVSLFSRDLRSPVLSLAGMTSPVVNFPIQDSRRFTAHWCPQVWCLDSCASAPASRCTSSRQASTAAGSPRRPLVLRVIPPNTLEPALDHDVPEGSLSRALDVVLSEDDEDEEQQCEERQSEDDVRLLSTAKRRK